jgi:hypothetical protein
MVDKLDVKESLRAAICLVTQKNVTLAQISFGVLEGDENNLDGLDEFNLD